jgi:hypothetical protein
MPTVVNIAQLAQQDIYFELANLDQHPIPSAEYQNKKDILSNLRAETEQMLKQNAPSEKKRGTAINPEVVRGFAANNTSSTPADNDIAVSNDLKIVSVVNSNMRVLDDTGKNLHSISLTNLCAAVGNYQYTSDPRVLYDPTSDRFVIVFFSGAISYQSTIIIGFTQTNDPAGNWNFYTINGNPFNDSTWSDYPIIALSDKDLFITFNLVKDNVGWQTGFKQSVIWQIKKSDGYNGAALNYHLWSNINYNNTPLRNICPAKYQTNAPGNKMYFVTLRNVAMSNDSLFLTEITDSYESGNATINLRLLQTPIQYGFPPNARQKAASNGVPQELMTNDGRVLAAIYENDYVHFGSNSINPMYNNAGVMLGTIKNVSSTNPTVVADILSSATFEYGYPSMTYVGQSPNDHKVLYSFSHCITDSFPGNSVVYKNAQDEFSDIIHVKYGEGIINRLASNTERWGDYSGIQKLYNNPNRVYMSNSWGKNNLMLTWITELAIKEWPVAVAEVSSEKFSSSIYPNPSSGQRVTMRFMLSENTFCHIDIVDMQGKIVKTLLRDFVKKGTNEISFDPANLPKGIYQVIVNDGIKNVMNEKLVVN